MDNGLSPPLNDLQAGVCAASVKTCGGADGWVNNYDGIDAHEADEVGCDGLDNDCDGLVDEGVAATFYEDADNDGFGAAAVSQSSCIEVAGYVLNDADCDDDDALEHPGQTWREDADGDSYSSGNTSVQCERPANHYPSSELTAASGDCNDGDGAIHPGASEACDGQDNDCNGEVDNGLSPPLNDLQAGVCAASVKTCGRADGWVNNYGGIDAHEADEVGCDGLDNDCDGQVDEGVTATFYEDADNDGFGAAAVTREACAAPEGFVADNTDYDDGDGNIHPGSPVIRLIGAGTEYFGGQELQAAYNSVQEGVIIQINAAAHDGDLFINQNKTVTIQGGFDHGFSNTGSATVIHGAIIVSGGCVTVENIVLQ